MHLKTNNCAKNCLPGLRWWPVLFLLAVLACSAPYIVSTAFADETNTAPHYNVQAYVIAGKFPLSADLTTPLFAKYTGTNVSLDSLVQAASDLQAVYEQQGYSKVNIVIAPQRISNGTVTLNVFQGALAQIVISGQRYSGPDSLAEIASALSLAPPPTPPAAPTAATVTNPPPPVVVYHPLVPATPEQMAADRAALIQKIAELKAQAADTRVHVVSTNAGPRFPVSNYLISGNTLLPPTTIAETLTNIDGAYGTNVSLDGIRTVVKEIQGDYRKRGYVTVSVALPQQKLTNATVKLQITEGRLEDIRVKGNHYFSSNNVMRAMPSLHTNMILNSLVFQAELNRANASQDRQIYPIIEPGLEPGTSDLTLDVKDRVPLHAKVELNNQNSPGTPDLRLNTSAVYDNLWQHENSLGLQYSFSPQDYKNGNQWNFYDQPLVANYSAFYRIPLGGAQAIEDVIDANPGTFGYSEATRKFNLPPPSGQPDLTVFASRSTIDTGLNHAANQNVYTSASTNFNGSITTNSTLNLSSISQNLTVNEDVGFRLTLPLQGLDSFHSDVAGGLDFKSYNLTSASTNIYTLNSTIIDTLGGSPETNYNTSSDTSPLAGSVNQMYYLPLSVRYDAGWNDSWGTASAGLGLSANLWYSSSTVNGSGTNAVHLHGAKSIQSITGSKESSGYWVVLNPSFSHTINLITDWPTIVRADGQWASQPLISNEQFGAGGVNSVRGYHEGEVFGDTGWHFSLEQQTPSAIVGEVYGKNPLILRGSVYMDYADTYLLDPQGRPGHTALWSTGIGTVATIGPYWEARFLFSLPLLKSDTTGQFQPFVNFSITAQF